jgi:integrase
MAGDIIGGRCIELGCIWSSFTGFPQQYSMSRAITRHFQEAGFQQKFTPHDLRRTLRTKLAEIGIPEHIAERVLGHKLQGILAVYNRYSYDQEKSEALEKWEARLRQIIEVPPQVETRSGQGE